MMEFSFLKDIAAFESTAKFETSRLPVQIERPPHIDRVTGMDRTPFLNLFEQNYTELKGALEPFNEENWKDLSDSKRQKQIEKLVKTVADSVCLQTEPNIVYGYCPHWMEPDGNVTAENNTVWINKTEMDDPCRTATNVAFRIWYAYMYQEANDPVNAYQEQYKEGFDNFICFEEDPIGYRTQFIQREAETFANSFESFYNNCFGISLIDDYETEPLYPEHATFEEPDSLQPDKSVDETKKLPSQLDCPHSDKNAEIPVSEGQLMDEPEQTATKVEAAPSESEDGIERTGLSEAEKNLIMKETGWPAKIVIFIESMEQYEVYKKADLHYAEINGRPCLLKDIDWDYEDPKTGLTNRQLVFEKHRVPIDKKTGEKIELHHMGQDFDSPFAELCENSEHGDGNDLILHDKGVESWRRDPEMKNQYAAQKREHWQIRASEA